MERESLHKVMSELIINSKFFKYNLDIITSHIGDKNKLALVLKDNAYGHGIEYIAPLVVAYGIKNVFVKNEAEALRVSNLFENITAFYGKINPKSPKNIYMTLSSLESIEDTFEGLGVEIEVNAGMNRNGIESQDIRICIEKLLEKKVRIIGVFSHNGYGDERNEDFLNSQSKFLSIKKEVQQLSKILNFPLPRFHSLSSSGALLSDFIEDDIVRVGIAAYGYCDPIKPNKVTLDLKPIASLWADKISTHTLCAGSKIGYGGKSILDKEEIVSSYDIGYGDGLFRLNANKKELLSAEGYKILPITSMDCFSCICDKDRICVFNDARIMARVFDTISYEILTHLSPFIKRTIV